MTANAKMIKLGELYGVKLGQLKEKLEKQRNNREDATEECEMEERIVPELKSKPIDINKLKQNGDHVREFVSEIRNFMMESAKNLSIIQALPSEERELAEDDERHLIAEMEKAMQVKVASARAAALAAYTIAKAAFCEPVKNNILDLLIDLSNRGILVKSIARENFILAWDKKYIVAPSMRQHAPDISQALITLVSKAWSIEKAKYQQEKKSLAEKTGVSISIAELFAGKTGRAGFDVPAQTLEINRMEEMISEGFIVVEYDGKKIAPIAAVGNIKPLVAELREKQTFLLSHTLEWSGFKVRIDGPEYSRRLCILFNILKAGLALYKKQSATP